MRVHLAKKPPLRPEILLVSLLLAGCEAAPTAPASSIQSNPVPRAIVVTPGLSVYTDRAAWATAVATAGGTVVNMDFTGLTLGRVTQLVTNYGDFGIVIDDVSASQFSNPGIDVFADASCSLGTGDCEVFTFNMKSASSGQDAPTFNKLGFPQDIIAFGGDFIQLGMTAPAPGSVTGPVTLQIGTETVVVNSYLDANGNGFFGFVATADDTVKFTYAQSASLQNDIFQIYNPAYANAPAGADPEAMIGDLQSTIAAMTLGSGLATSLDAKLRAAAAALSVDNAAAACVALQDLLNYVNAQRGKKLTTGNADTILNAAGAIRTELGC